MALVSSKFTISLLDIFLIIPRWRNISLTFQIVQVPFRLGDVGILFCFLGCRLSKYKKKIIAASALFATLRTQKKSSEQRHRGRHFTCSNYLKDTGRSLRADNVLSPAGECAVVQFRYWGVPQDAHGAVASGSEPLW